MEDLIYEFTVDDAHVKLNINIFTSTKFVGSSNFYITRKAQCTRHIYSWTYDKSEEWCPAPVTVHLIFLLHSRNRLHVADCSVANYLDSQYTDAYLFFSLSLMHKGFNK